MASKEKGVQTAGLVIQSVISRVLDDDNFVTMGSLDLSSAFDVVNVELLLKSLAKMGILRPKLRYCYVSVNSSNSHYYTTEVGTVQGFILGPILFAIVDDLQRFDSKLFSSNQLNNSIQKAKRQFSNQNQQALRRAG